MTAKSRNRALLLIGVLAALGIMASANNIPAPPEEGAPTLKIETVAERAEADRVLAAVAAKCGAQPSRIHKFAPTALTARAKTVSADYTVVCAGVYGAQVCGEKSDHCAAGEIINVNKWTNVQPKS